MKKFKTVIGASLCLTLLFSFAACTPKSKMEYKTPEGMLIATLDSARMGEMSWEDFWEQHVSKITKKLDNFSKDLFVQEMSKKYPKLNYTSTLSLIERTDVDKNIFKVDLNYQTTNTTGQANPKTVTEYVEYTGGEYKLIYDGIYNWKTYSLAEEPNALAVTKVDAKYRYGGYMLSFNFKNNDSVKNCVGYLKGAALSAVTTEGTYNSNFDVMYTVEAGQELSVSATFPKMKGKLKEVTISDVYLTDENGIIVSPGSGGKTIQFTV